MLEVKIEGVYESDIGSGQKKFYPFEYVYKTARINPKGLFTHALRRHAPYLIQSDKKNAKALYSRIQSLTIVDIKKLNEPCSLAGKDVNTLNAWEIQDLACLYDLYDIPINGTIPFAELREKAVVSYLENVLKIPMKTDKDKEALDFFIKQEDGTYKLDIGNMEIPIEIKESLIEKKIGVVKKKGIADFIRNTGRTVANGILSATGNQTVGNSEDEDSDENQGNRMPSANELLNQ